MSFVVNSRKLVVASPRGRGLRAVARPAGDVHIAVGADSRPLSTGAFAMLATRPATSPTLAPFQLLLGPADATLPRYLLLGILDPADEFVAGQRRDVIPGIESGGVGDQRRAQVTWKLVHDPTGHSQAAHSATVAGRGEPEYRQLLRPDDPPSRSCRSSIRALTEISLGRPKPPLNASRRRIARRLVVRTNEEMEHRFSPPIST
jgi:hypothetical protein